jgi:spermidine synthase
MLLMFLLSGVAALIYQIVWAKELALVFGVTVYATSAVVTAFMGGLALGSLYFGRVVDRWQRPLLLFAFLEAGIAAFALVFPFVAALLERIYVAFYGPLGESHYVMSLVRFALSFAVLLVPTSLMGGTLPVITRAYVSRTRRIGSEVAGLYSANNIGAFLGCMLAGYVALELLGLSGTLLLAALLNITVAVLALLLGLRSAPGIATDGDERAPEPAVTEAMAGPVKVALWVFGIEGFTSLAYQMAWVRMLIFFVETDIYGVTTIIATYLVGLALGAFVVRWWVDRTGDAFRLLGVIEIGIGLSALSTIPFLPRLLGLYTGLRDAVGAWGFGGWTLERFAICFAVILVPTTFMGATMPVVARIYVKAVKGLGRRMGIIGCLDTVGSILGAFAGAFIMIPVLGIQRTIIVTALVNLALAAWVFAADVRARQRSLFRPGFAVAAVALLLSPLLLSLEPVPLVVFSRGIGKLLRAGEVRFYSEDAESSVAVIEEYGRFRSLTVNHAVVAQNTRYDRPNQEMIAHVPILLHPEPKRVLLIGFGIGFTTRAAAVHGVEVDVVELSPGVLAAGDWFAQDNDQILDHERVRVRVDDGRNYVLGTERKYDVVQAGIIHPAISSGNAGFYTCDFYRECKRLLAPGGVMCQWLPLHGIPVEDFKMMIRSFQAEYPYTSLWFKHGPYSSVLVGTPQPLRVDFEDAERRFKVPAVRAHFANGGVVNVYDFLDSFLSADESLRRLAGHGPLHTDDHPYVEFHCNRPQRGPGQVGSIHMLARGRQPVLPRLTNIPAGRRDEVRATLARWFAASQHVIVAHYAGKVAETLMEPGNADYDRYYQLMNESFGRALELNPADENALFHWNRRRIMHHKAVANALYDQGDVEGALEHLAAASRLAPDTYHGTEARAFFDLIAREYGAPPERPETPVRPAGEP